MKDFDDYKVQSAQPCPQPPFGQPVSARQASFTLVGQNSQRPVDASPVDQELLAGETSRNAHLVFFAFSELKFKIILAILNKFDNAYREYDEETQLINTYLCAYLQNLNIANAKTVFTALLMKLQKLFRETKSQQTLTLLKQLIKYIFDCSQALQKIELTNSIISLSTDNFLYDAINQQALPRNKSLEEYCVELEGLRKLYNSKTANLRRYGNHVATLDFVSFIKNSYILSRKYRKYLKFVDQNFSAKATQLNTMLNSEIITAQQVQDAQGKDHWLRRKYDKYNDRFGISMALVVVGTIVTSTAATYIGFLIGSAIGTAIFPLAGTIIGGLIGIFVGVIFWALMAKLALTRSGNQEKANKYRLTTKEINNYRSKSGNVDQANLALTKLKDLAHPQENTVKREDKKFYKHVASEIKAGRYLSLKFDADNSFTFFSREILTRNVRGISTETQVTGIMMPQGQDVFVEAQGEHDIKLQQTKKLLYSKLRALHPGAQQVPIKTSIFLARKIASYLPKNAPPPAPEPDAEATSPSVPVSSLYQFRGIMR